MKWTQLGSLTPKPTDQSSSCSWYCAKGGRGMTHWNSVLFFPFEKRQVVPWALFLGCGEVVERDRYPQKWDDLGNRAGDQYRWFDHHSFLFRYHLDRRQMILTYLGLRIGQAHCWAWVKLERNHSWSVWFGKNQVPGLLSTRIKSIKIEDVTWFLQCFVCIIIQDAEVQKDAKLVFHPEQPGGLVLHVMSVDELVGEVNHQILNGSSTNSPPHPNPPWT